MGQGGTKLFRRIVASAAGGVPKLSRRMPALDFGLRFASSIHEINSRYFHNQILKYRDAAY
jgi:hypothetical protein